MFLHLNRVLTEAEDWLGMPEANLGRDGISVAYLLTSLGGFGPLGEGDEDDDGKMPILACPILFR